MFADLHFDTLHAMIRVGVSISSKPLMPVSGFFTCLPSSSVVLLHPCLCREPRLQQIKA